MLLHFNISLVPPSVIVADQKAAWNNNKVTGMSKLSIDQSSSRIEKEVIL